MLLSAASPLSEEEPSASFAPLLPVAEAVEDTTDSEAPDAAKVTAPPEWTEEEVVDSTSSSTRARAKAAPIAAFSAATSPEAAVATVEIWTAVTVTSPDVTSVPPDTLAPIVAAVSLLTSDRATTGVIATPPSAPWDACVTTACVASASSDTAPAPVRSTPSAMLAVERVATRFSATEAPTPTLPPDAPSPDGSAAAIDEVSLSVASVTSP